MSAALSVNADGAPCGVTGMNADGVAGGVTGVNADGAVGGVTGVNAIGDAGEALGATAVAGRHADAAAPWIGRSDRGSVTAELAVAMPVVTLVLIAGLTGVGGLVTKLRCVDAAREVARAEARGAAAPDASMPRDAVVTTTRDGDLIRVVVRAPVRVLAPWTIAFAVEGEATAASEPIGHVP